MKTSRILLTAFTFSVFLFSSCSKEEQNNGSVSSTSSVTSKNIQVEYRVTNVSGSVELKYIAPVDGKLQTITERTKRTYKVISFEWTNNNTYSIEAWNTVPSTDEVYVDIYVDGVLFKSGQSDFNHQVAKAEGFVY